MAGNQRTPGGQGIPRKKAPKNTAARLEGGAQNTTSIAIIAGILTQAVPWSLSLMGYTINHDIGMAILVLSLALFFWLLKLMWGQYKALAIGIFVLVLLSSGFLYKTLSKSQGIVEDLKDKAVIAASVDVPNRQPPIAAASPEPIDYTRLGKEIAGSLTKDPEIQLLEIAERTQKEFRNLIEDANRKLEDASSSSPEQTIDAYRRVSDEVSITYFALYRDRLVAVTRELQRQLPNKFSLIRDRSRSVVPQGLSDLIDFDTELSVLIEAYRSKLVSQGKINQ